MARDLNSERLICAILNKSFHRLVHKGLPIWIAITIAELRHSSEFYIHLLPYPWIDKSYFENLLIHSEIHSGVEGIHIDDVD